MDCVKAGIWPRKHTGNAVISDKTAFTKLDFREMANSQELAVSTDAAFADEIRSGVICTSSKQQYKRKFQHFIEYIKTYHAEFYVPDNSDIDYVAVQNSETVMAGFFGYICKKRKKDGTLIEPVRYQSFQHVSGYKSAIKFHFMKIEHLHSFDKAMDSFFSDFHAGYQRLIGELKQNGEMSLIEGKQQLSFQGKQVFKYISLCVYLVFKCVYILCVYMTTFLGYKYLANKAICQDTDFQQAIFAHVFLVLCWNLMARCVSVSGLMYSHISWNTDALRIVFPTHKGDKEGANSLPKHVFANPTCPAICPILALAVFVWTCGVRRANSKPTLFI